MADDDIGTLYVLANRDNSLAKIGLTRNGTPDTRADDYSRAHGIEWRVFWQASSLRVGEMESHIHRELANHRFAMVSGAREIFHVTPAGAVRIAERYVIQPPPSPAPTPSAWNMNGAPASPSDAITPTQIAAAQALLARAQEQARAKLRAEQEAAEMQRLLALGREYERELAARRAAELAATEAKRKRDAEAAERTLKWEWDRDPPYQPPRITDPETNFKLIAKVLLLGMVIVIGFLFLVIAVHHLLLG